MKIKLFLSFSKGRKLLIHKRKRQFDAQLVPTIEKIFPNYRFPPEMYECETQWLRSSQNEKAKRKDECRMNKTISQVGSTKVGHWFDGVAPESVEGATLLGYRKVGGYLELALYELPNGDFCSITGDSGMVVRRREFPQLVMDEGCPWEFTDAQFKRMTKLLGKIKAENQDSGYDALKAAAEMPHGHGVIADLFNLFVSEALKANPPDIEAADKVVVKAIVDKVDSMGVKDGDKCVRTARSLYHDFRSYTAKTFKKVEQKMNEVA